MYKLNLKLTVLALVLIPSFASAQVWLPERASREGAGIKLGDSLVLHPGIGVEGGYDTNVLRKNPDSNSGVVGAGRLRVTPYLDLATRSDKRRVQDKGVIDASPPKVDFRLGLAGYYDWFFSDVEAVDEQDHLGIDTNLNFVLFPEGAFSFLIDADYMRTLQPYESGSENWAWHQIHPGAGFRIKPGGGTLSFEAGYRLTMLIYEDDMAARTNDKQVHDMRFVSSWRIFPKTALISKMNFSPTIYNDTSTPAVGEAFTATANVNSMPVRALMGLQGLLTPRFGLTLFAGYGASFYDSGENYDSFIGNGELMFFLTPTANIRLGGQRDFVDSFYSNYYTKTGGYLKYEQMFGGVVLASLKGDLNYRQYSTVAPTSQDTSANLNDRDELWVGATLLVEVRATDWLSIFASGVFQANITDYENAFDYDPDPSDDDDSTVFDYSKVGFNRFEAMGGIRVHY